MEEVLEMAVSDPSSGHPTFLAHFDSLEFNSLIASHFHRFGPPFASFLLFSIPADGLPFLEGLFTAHGDFTSEFRGGVFLGNISMELLCAVLISLRDSSLDSLYEERLLEWRRVVQDLIKPSPICPFSWSTCDPQLTHYSRGRLLRILMLKSLLLRKFQLMLTRHCKI